jgi:hypothetical protein
MGKCQNEETKRAIEDTNEGVSETNEEVEEANEEQKKPAWRGLVWFVSRYAA